MVRRSLPRHVRDPLQLRADVGPSGRVDLIRTHRGRPSLRRARLRRGASRARGRGRALLRRRTQGDGPLRHVGAPRRDRPHGRSGAPARRAPAAPARGPARLPPQPDLAGAARRAHARQGARRTPDAGRTVRQARDRRLRSRPRQLDRAGAGQPRLLRSQRPAGPHTRGGGGSHSRPRAGSARRRRRRVARQRGRARRLEPGLDRQRSRLSRRRPAG